MGAYSDRVIADGASNYWRLGETSGLTAVDIAGGANGTISGGVTLGAAGAIGDGTTAMTFTAAGGGKIDTAAVSIPLTATIEAWVKTSVTTLYKVILSTRGTGGTGALIYFGINDSGKFVTLSGAASLTGSLVVADGHWHHLVLVLTGGATAACYIDGAPHVSGAFVRAATALGNGNIAYEFGSGYYWDGSLDEVAIYPRALTANEIAAHYALGLGQSPPTNYAQRVMFDGASSYWRLGETVGTTAVDSVGGAHGTISGGVTLGAAGALADGNTAMTFDGTTGKVQTSASVSIPLVCTIEGWLRLATITSVRAMVGTRNLPGASGDGVLVGVDSGLVAVHSGLVAQGGRLVADNQWHHAACVFTSGTSVSLYVDGTFDATAAIARTTPGAGSAAVGFDNAAAGLFFPGSLDEVAIYPRALTAPEIAVHYTLATSAGGGVRTLSFGYWKQRWPAA